MNVTRYIRLLLITFLTNVKLGFKHPFMRLIAAALTSCRCFLRCDCEHCYCWLTGVTLYTNVTALLWFHKQYIVLYWTVLFSILHLSLQRLADNVLEAILYSVELHQNLSDPHRPERCCKEAFLHFKGVPSSKIPAVFCIYTFYRKENILNSL